MTEILKFKHFKENCLNLCKDINIFFVPLFKLLGIHGFSYMKIFPDNSRVFLTNDIKWAENYFIQNYFQSQHINRYKYLTKYMLWVQWPKEDEGYVQLIKDAYELNYGNALAIHRGNEKYIELFGLRGYIHDTDVNYRYFTYLDEINKFLDFFLIKFAKVIKKLEENKFQTAYSIDKDFSFKKLEHIKKEGLAMMNQILHPETLEPFLTKREEECLKKILIGKTAKEIAKELNISNRTVEKHFISLKQKVNAFSRSELIDKVLSVRYNRGILLDLY